MNASLKEEIFQMLENGRGTSVSGEEMAGALSVSRNAVWKAVKSLRDEGYEIESCRNRGYKLLGEKDRLSAAAIRAGLGNGDIGIYVYESLDSTNNEAKRLLANGLQGEAIIVAEGQTGGRGRLGRSFYSPAGGGVYMTLVLRPKASMQDAVTLTTAAAVAVVCAIEELSGKRPEIKWVNDVYLGGKKICGILTEAVSDFEAGTIQSVLVGIGVNMKTQDFPEEIQEKAASLNEQTIPRSDMIAAIAKTMLKICEDIHSKEYLEIYRSHSMVIGKNVDYFENGQAFSAVAVAIDDMGGLIVRHADGSERTLFSGEISLRIS